MTLYPIRKRQLRFTRLLAITALLLAPGMYIKAQLPGMNAKTTTIYKDEYGAFIDFRLPVAEFPVVGTPIWLTASELIVSDGTVNKTVAAYRSLNSGASGKDQAALTIQLGQAGRTIGWAGNGYQAMQTPAQNATHQLRTAQEGFFIEYFDFRWYLPENLFDKKLTFTINYTLNNNSAAKTYTLTNADGSTGDSIPFPLLNAALTNKFSGTPGKTDITYSYTGAGAVGDATVPGVNFYDFYTITHRLIDSSTSPIGTSPTDTDGPNGNISGTLTTGMSNMPQTYFETNFTGKDGFVQYRKLQQTPPAYQWPAAINTVYNDTTGIVTLSWNINALNSNDNYIQGDEFEVQRSFDPTFSTADYKTYKVSYDVGTTGYSITDNLTDLNVQNKVYYRLRRTKSANDWGWSEARKDTITIQMKLMQPVAPTSVNVDESNNAPRVVLTWNVQEGVWPTGARFIIRRTGSNGTSTDISLDKAGLQTGRYEDRNITTCVDYTYTLFVQAASPYNNTPDVTISGKAKFYSQGTISNLQASKGYFANRVELQWYSEGVFSQYAIYRSAGGSFSSAVNIATVSAISTAGTTMLYEDARAIAGTYYTYYVKGIKQCGAETSMTDSLVAVGFRSPTGNIYGRVTYENGQAVENVAVRLQNNNGTLPNKSILLNGSAGSYLQIDSLHTPFSGNAFTVECWIKPAGVQPAGQVLFGRYGQYEIGFNSAGQLYFTAYGKTVSGTYSNPNQSFVHVAAAYSSDSLILYFNSERMAAVTGVQPAGTPAKTVYIGRNSNGNYYNGYIDELRIWNRAVTATEIKANYTRMLVGSEDGLAAYCRFDETIAGQFYDLSQQADVFNRNDGYMNPAAVTRTSTIPTADQLALRGVTDASGNYMISGIPYTDNGITYTVIPVLGIHQFSPVSVNRLLSANSNEFTVDFTDNSSFPVSGAIYYRNSTIPVKGVQFKIDGAYAHLQNGTIIETDDAGKFTIYVPVGTHEVQALKQNHVFENEGLITDRFGANLNYQDAISERVLYDNTTIRFIGRVAGGAVQEALPLAHSVSRNNLGEKLSVTLELAGAQNRKINASDTNTDSLVTVNHLLPSNQGAKQHKTKVSYKEYAIIIQPDSITGEFVTDLIPENYNIVSVKATGHGDLIGNNPVNVNLGDKFVQQKEAYSYKDSTLTANGNWIYSNYNDTVWYNEKYRFIYRERPNISLVQLNDAGSPVEYLGSPDTKTTNVAGTTTTIEVYNATTKTYLFEYPVFNQNTPYTFKINAFEEYEFFNESNIVTPASTEKVPTADGVVSLANNLRDGSSGVDTFSLNDKGEATYGFYAGEPEMGDGIGRKGFSMSVKIGSQVIQWNNGATREAYIMGGRKTGTDFVTAGPNEIITILRDPGGSNSAAYFEQGTSFTRTQEYSTHGSQFGNGGAEALFGVEIATSTGVGFEIKNSAKTINTTDFKFSHQENWINSDTKSETSVLVSRFTTSADPQYVGAGGDLFIGNSTNISYGATLNMVPVLNSEVNATDVIFFDGRLKNIPYCIIQRRGINVDQKFGTVFAYPQLHIENVLIPNLVSFRNNLLLPLGTSDAVAQQRADALSAQVYVSKLASTDARFGAANNDATLFGDAAKANWTDGPSYRIFKPAIAQFESDTLLVINQYIAGWKAELALNEKAKLEASTLVKNYSFTGGATVQGTEQLNYNSSQSKSFDYIIGQSVATEMGFSLNGTGVLFKLEEGGDGGKGQVTTTDNGSTTSFGYTFSESGTDYLSIDVLKAANGSFVFKTKGGVTQCPYEGAGVTRYYQPGAVIDQPTMQAEVPGISVAQPVVSDIPSSRKASYVVNLFNASDIKSGATFRIRVGDQSNPNGAKVYMDGTELGTGRDIAVPSGDALTKTITLERGPSAMDYENIQIILQSACETTIADTVMISAHFIPSCSDINIKSPADQWVLNTSSPINDNGDYYLPVTIDQFDITNSQFDHIELQYKPSSAAAWVTVMKFYSDTAKYNASQGEKMKITQNGVIDYNLAMSAPAFNDQRYDVRAVSICMSNDQVIASTESNEVTGVKDTYNPRLFGNPQPADGMLGIEDDIRIDFNESIAEGLLSNADFQVTGIRNGNLNDHSVAVQLDGRNDYLTTAFGKNFAAKNITVETWALPNAAANGTLFSQGAGSETLELALTSDNYLEVTAGSKTIKSAAPVPYKQGGWAHVALVLNAAAKTVSAYYNFQAVINDAQVNEYTGNGIIQIGRSIKKNGNFFAGKLHEMRIWSDVKTAITLQQNSLTYLSGEENGLLAYYPMNEGKGNTAFDKARGVNATLTGTWSMPAGKAVSFNGDGYVILNTAYAPIVKAMDFTLECWFKGEPGQQNASLLSSGKGDRLELDSASNTFFLGFENGLLSFKNNGTQVTAEGSYLDNNWHHVSIAVNRNAGTGQMLVDGLLKRSFDALGLGGIASANTFLGARGWYSIADSLNLNIDNYFKGNIDEVRIWNTYLSQSFIAQNNNVALKGDEFGLLAYYPFSKYFIFQNNQELGYTLSDMRIQEQANVTVPDAVAKNAAESNETAPVKARGPVENLQFNYVANDDALIINLLEPRQAVDKTIVTLKARNIRDKNGNIILSPITWSAYINRNPLKWSDDEISLSKDVYAGLQFEAQMINNGGSIMKYSLTNLPAWLTASPASGTIDPQAKQKVVFTVNKGLNVGAYDEIVYLLNDNNESGPLAINLTVKGLKPDWTATKGLNNMIVYGKLRTGNIFSNNAEDMLAAFTNGKCVGVANNEYFSTNDEWYVLMSVNSDSVRQSNLEFRIWEAATGKTYVATPSQQVLFVRDTIYGSPRNPVIFDGSDRLFQNINLNNGWNWISFNVTSPSLNSVAAALANGNWASGDLVKNDSGAGKFAVYSVSAGWVSDSLTFNNTSMYKLKTANEQTLSISGMKADLANTPVHVEGGKWNYISYLPLVNVSLKEALAGYNASEEDVIKSQTGFAMYDARIGWVGNLTWLEPGKGYMLYRKATTNTVFVYPTISGILTGAGGRVATLNTAQTPVGNNYVYAENMTMVAVVENGFDLLPGDKVLAWSGAELRGEANTIDNPVTHKRTLFINIAGAASQLLYFTVERNGQTIAATDQPLLYESNSSVGSLQDPYVIRFSKETTITADRVYPNPFSKEVKVRVTLNGGQGTGNKLQWNVYDLSGKLVWSSSPVIAAATYYELSWNGRNNNGGICAQGVYMISVTVNGKRKMYKITKL